MSKPASPSSKGFPWKLVLWAAAIALVMYAVPQLRPANIANSLQIFANTLQANMGHSQP